MTSASMAVASPHIPHLSIPRFHWSPRSRALMMMVIMISPAFLCDTIGNCIERLVYTADQIAELRAPDMTLANFHIFRVACPDAKAPAATQERWERYAAQRGWPLYLPAGPGCFNPDEDLRGALGLMAFSVACPDAVLSALDRRRWVAYAADRGWTEYPQAGAGCVDP
jgi:hypothetical protein